jgi:lipopolysaccharide assembly protein A
MPRLAKICLFLFMILLGLLFHLRNQQSVQIDYYLGSLDLALSATLVIILCFGVILGFLVGIPAKIAQKRESARLRKQLDMAEKEIDALRVIPVKNDL